MELLSRADLFITHSGLNSIKESIFYAVPMLVFPIEFKTDHPGNAARIVYHVLGLRGDARKDSAPEIKKDQIASFRWKLQKKHSVISTGRKRKGR